MSLFHQRINSPIGPGFNPDPVGDIPTGSPTGLRLPQAPWD